MFTTVVLSACAHASALEQDQEFAAGSKIELDAPSPEQIEHLVVLAKVWGFLEFHHPRVTSGELQWDFELFRVLPSVVAATDASERNAVLLRWVESLGEVPVCRRCASLPAELHLQPPIEWIHDEALLGAELSRALEHVWINRPNGAQLWVGRGTVGNASFSRQPAYAELEQVDAGYRLLAAFRAWNLIAWWFPYRDVMDEDWDGVLRELLPVFIAAHERDDYQRALLLLMARTHDSHAIVLTALDAWPPSGSCWVPAWLRFLDDQPIVTWASEPATKLRAGDRLLAIAGRPVAEIVEAWRPYYVASNEDAQRRDIAFTLLRGECGPVSVELERDGRALALELERVEVTSDQVPDFLDRPGDTFQSLGEDVAYLKLSTIEREHVRRYIKAAAGTRGLIVDIRSYPGDMVVSELAGHLVDERTAFVRFTQPDLATPGAFVWTDAHGLEPRAPHYSGKVVVLVDAMSQSNAEYTAMALRAGPRTIVVGSTTAGADGNVSAFPLPGGERARFSGIGVFYPDRRPTQRVGIVPDITVRPTREGIRDGRDEVLERALREILGPDVPEAEIRALASVE